MKKHFYILVIMTVALFSTCKKDPPPTVLDISITQHPVGGASVSTLSANFNGKITGTVKTVSVTVEWWWEDGNHANAALQNSSEVIFNSNNSTSKSVTKSTSSGYIFLNYYWVKIKWTDDNGPNVVESSKAYCTR